MCIHYLFENQVEHTPKRVAVVFQGQQLTYQELNQRANQLAHHLMTLGVKPEVRVGICVERSLEMVIGLLAILKAGGAYVPLGAHYPSERLAFMLEDAQVPILLTQQHLLPLFNSPPLTLCLDSDGEQFFQEHKSNPSHQTTLDNLAYVIYTSGSTGRPKGVEIQHKGVVNLIKWHQHTYRVTPLDRATQISNLTFDASVWEIWPYLTAGASLYLPHEETRRSPLQLLEWLATEEITLCFLPTPLAEAVLKETLPAHLKLRALLTGGDQLHPLVGPTLPFKVVNHYGPTENTVVTTYAPVKLGDSRFPPIGRPILNTQIYVLDSNLQRVPIGVPGELYIWGVGLARGYLNRPDLTSEKFVPNPFSNNVQDRLYKTGDLVRFRADGLLEFLGRLDTQVNLRGLRIELGEIETVLSQHSHVQEVVVTVLQKDSPEDKQLIAYVTLKQFVSSSELRDFLKKTLPDYMVPSSFIVLENLPLTPNGKIDRQALPKPEELGSLEYVAPQNEMEQQIAQIWQEVLHREKISVKDNFFEVGGNSLLLVQLYNQLVKIVTREISMITLFHYPTIRMLSDYLSSALTEDERETFHGNIQKQKEFRERHRQRHKGLKGE